MKRVLSFIILVAIFNNVVAAANRIDAPLDVRECVSFIPYGMPQPVKHNNVQICRHGYLSLYDTTAKVPTWVSHNVSKGTAFGCLPRRNTFSVDNSLESYQQSKPSDYVHSDYDMGHMANNADFSYDIKVQQESFYMSNMSPQSPTLNRGSWKMLETVVRAWAGINGYNLTVFNGTVISPSDAKIGADDVVVPHQFYSVIFRDDGQYLAFKFDQNTVIEDISEVQTTLADIESISGITFPVKVGISKVAKGDIWPHDVSALAKMKKVMCKQ